jgi:DNA processing protein
MISLDFGRLRLVKDGYSRSEGRVLSALVASPSRPDDLAALLGENPLTLLRTLSDYESRGIVERLWDGRYAPSKEYLCSHTRFEKR